MHAVHAWGCCCDTTCKLQALMRCLNTLQSKSTALPASHAQSYMTQPSVPALCHGLQAVLIPSVHVGGGNSMPGCFTHQGGVTITTGQLFLWELIMTFVLVSTVYAVAVTKPGHGNIGPLAVGFSLFASAFIGEPQHHHTILCSLPAPTLPVDTSLTAVLQCTIVQQMLATACHCLGTAPCVNHDICC